MDDIIITHILQYQVLADLNAVGTTHVCVQVETYISFSIYVIFVMGVCASKNEVGEDPILELGNRLDKINTYYPGTDFTCLMDLNGDIVVDKNLGSTKEAAAILQQVFLIKKASRHFSKTLDSKCGECEIIHIRGEYTIISVWVINVYIDNNSKGNNVNNPKNNGVQQTFVLMFKTKMINTNPIEFNLDEADKNMRKEIIKDVKFYLTMYADEERKKKKR